MLLKEWARSPTSSCGLHLDLVTKLSLGKMFCAVLSALIGLSTTRHTNNQLNTATISIAPAV